MSERLSAIGEVISPVKTWNPLSESQDGTFRYIDLSSVDNETKEIRAIQEVPVKDAPSRARQLVESGDILVSTVRPNLNGVAKLDRRHNGATASTGFCVLRPNPQVVCRDYLFQWVKSPGFVADMMRKATGASYPAVSDRIIAESFIPLLPLDEQRRIAAILDQADDLRRKRRQVLDRLQELKSISFETMFLGSQASGFSWGRIEDLTSSTQYGTSSKAGDSGDFPILRMGNLSYDGEIDTADLKYLDLSPNDLAKHTVAPSDILFNRTNSPDLVGKTAVFRETDGVYAFAGYLIRLRVNDRADPEFVSGYLNSKRGKAVLRGMCKAIIGMANINAQELRRIPIPLPPPDLQREFAARVVEINKLKAHHRVHLAKLDALFASLQHRAFRGEL